MENLSSSYFNNQIKSPSFNKLNKNKILKKELIPAKINICFDNDKNIDNKFEKTHKFYFVKKNIIFQ